MKIKLAIYLLLTTLSLVSSNGDAWLDDGGLTLAYEWSPEAANRVQWVDGDRKYGEMFMKTGSSSEPKDPQYFRSIMYVYDNHPAEARFGVVEDFGPNGAELRCYMSEDTGHREISLQVDGTGHVYVDAEGTILYRATRVWSDDASTVPLVVKSAEGQVANLSEWRDEDGNLLMSIDNEGRLILHSATGTVDLVRTITSLQQQIKRLEVKREQ